jgi:hypothetical protein
VAEHPRAKADLAVVTEGRILAVTQAAPHRSKLGIVTRLNSLQILGRKEFPCCAKTVGIRKGAATAPSRRDCSV